MLREQGRDFKSKNLSNIAFFNFLSNIKSSFYKSAVEGNCVQFFLLQKIDPLITDAYGKCGMQYAIDYGIEKNYFKAAHEIYSDCEVNLVESFSTSSMKNTSIDRQYGEHKDTLAHYLSKKYLDSKNQKTILKEVRSLFSSLKNKVTNKAGLTCSDYEKILDSQFTLLSNSNHQEAMSILRETKLYVTQKESEYLEFLKLHQKKFDNLIGFLAWDHLDKQSKQLIKSEFKKISNEDLKYLVVSFFIFCLLIYIYIYFFIY